MEILILNEAEKIFLQGRYEKKGLGKLKIEPIEIQEVDGEKRYFLPSRIKIDPRLSDKKIIIQALPVDDIKNITIKEIEETPDLQDKKIK